MVKADHNSETGVLPDKRLLTQMGKFPGTRPLDRAAPSAERGEPQEAQNGLARVA